MLDFKLLNWKYMNFCMKFKDSTYIFTIKKMLKERHGIVDDLLICFNNYKQGNEILNEMLTLKECGLIGGQPERVVNDNGVVVINDDTLPIVQVFYQFTPKDRDPVLLYFKNK